MSEFELEVESESIPVTIEDVKLSLLCGVSISPVNMYRVKITVDGSWENRSRCCYMFASSLDELANKVLESISSLQEEAMRMLESSNADSEGDSESEDRQFQENDFFRWIVRRNLDDKESYYDVDVSNYAILPLLEQFTNTYGRCEWVYGRIDIESVTENAPVFSYRSFD
jgi:hypothetical protein